MNILIDIGHPAHVHYYRNLAMELTQRGHIVFWTVKDIPMAKKLLDLYGFTYKVFPKKSDNLIGKILKQLLYDIILFRYCKKHRITLAIGTSVSIAHVSKISGLQSIVYDDDDDDVQPLVTKYVNPYASSLLSPDILKGKRIRKDTIYYPGYHELAYLHPNNFKPDPSVLSEIGLKPGDPFFIMRFNVFKAHHDKGIKGLSLEQKLKLIEILKPHGKILITTERNIEPELQAFQMTITPDKAHSLMAYATMFLGDSQTMTSEAAVLGTPSLRCNTFAGRISYLEEQEKKYGLTFAYHPDDFEQLLHKLKELLNTPDLKSQWLTRRQKLLSEKIDLTAFMIWFTENYPKSAAIMKKDPDYALQFRQVQTTTKKPAQIG
jgi:predicted glycosyltransferase